MNLKELNKQKKYTLDQLKNLKKFEGKYLNVSLFHFDYWNNDKYETVYKVRGISFEIKEEYNLVKDIINY